MEFIVYFEEDGLPYVFYSQFDVDIAKRIFNSLSCDDEQRRDEFEWLLEDHKIDFTYELFEDGDFF